MMEPERISRIAYFVGIAQAAALVNGTTLTGSDKNVKDILEGIKLSIRTARADLYQLEEVTTEEVKKVMGMINYTWE